MSIHVVMKMPVASYMLRNEKAWEKVRPAIKQQILKDCNANVPMKDGFLRNSALRWAPMANDLIVWDTPYAHFQYIGKVMIGEISHRVWALKGEKKIYTDRNLTYRRGGSHWIEKTMADRKQAWGRLLASLLAKEVFK